MTRSGWLRLAGVGAVAAIVLLAVSMPRPAADPGPEFSEVVALPGAATAVPSVWYCPWINSGSIRETFVAIASQRDVEIAFTHPDPRVGEPEDVGEALLDGPGAAVQDIAGIVNRGDAPGFVEFSDGPATATAIVKWDTALSGDRCVSSTPKLWHLAGLTTREGYELILRLFNPIPDNAKVSVTASSELGSEALPDLQGIDVVGKTWVDIDLGDSIPFLDNLAITVGAEDGVIIPTVVQRRAGDEASWPGTGLSTEWQFPTTNLARLVPRLTVWNPNPDPVDIQVDLYTRTALIADAFTGTVGGGLPIEFPIGDQASAAVGLRVRASAPVAAAVVAEDVPPEPVGDEAADDAASPERIAATVGARAPAGSWLLAGAGAALGGDSSIWLLNTSAEAATVTLQPLGARQLAADKVRLEPNTVRRVRLTSSPGVGGYRVDSAVPITASWSLQTGDAVALFAGVAIES